MLIGTLVVFGVQVIPLNIRLSFENKPGLFMYWKQVKSVIPDYKNSKEGLKHQNTFESYISLMNGRILAQRCQALSKRSKLQCRKATMRGKTVCRSHGGASTGPKTEKGRKRCAIAKTVHGYETRAAREYRATKFIEMKSLFDSMYGHKCDKWSTKVSLAGIKGNRVG